MSETNNINREYKAERSHLVFATHGTQCVSPHGKREINLLQRGGWHRTRSKVIQNTGYIVLRDRDVRYCRSVRERRRNVFNERATHRALYRGC